MESTRHMLCYGADNMNRSYSNQQYIPPYTGYYGEYGPYGPNQADNTGINHENAVLSSTSPLASPNGTPSIQSDHLLREASNQILNSNNLTNQVSHLHEAMPQLHAHIPTVPSSVSWPENMALVSHGDVSAFSRVPPFDLYSTEQCGGNRRNPYEWMKRTGPPETHGQVNQTRTRTKDKYRVVYSDTQRLELEKEFAFNKYITIQRKGELSQQLNLTERQVKIWFQNRRAKERKITKRKGECDSENHDRENDGSTSPISAISDLSNDLKMEPR